MQQFFFPHRVSQAGVIDGSISDRQLIYCTRKTARIKSCCCHKQITFRSLKNYSAEVYEEALKNYLTTLTKLMKTSFKRSWQLLIILHPVKTNASRLHRKIGLMLKLWKKKSGGDRLFKKFKNLPYRSIKITIRKQGMRYKN